MSGGSLPYAKAQYFKPLKHQIRDGKPIRLLQGWSDKEKKSRQKSFAAFGQFELAKKVYRKRKALSRKDENRYARAYAYKSKNNQLETLSRYDNAPRWFERVLGEPRERERLTKIFLRALRS